MNISLTNLFINRLGIGNVFQFRTDINTTYYRYGLPIKLIKIVCIGLTFHVMEYLLYGEIKFTNTVNRITISRVMRI